MQAQHSHSQCKCGRHEQEEGTGIWVRPADQALAALQHVGNLIQHILHLQCDALHPVHLALQLRHQSSLQLVVLQMHAIVQAATQSVGRRMKALQCLQGCEREAALHPCCLQAKQLIFAAMGVTALSIRIGKGLCGDVDRSLTCYMRGLSVSKSQSLESCVTSSSSSSSASRSGSMGFGPPTSSLGYATTCIHVVCQVDFPRMGWCSYNCYWTRSKGQSSVTRTISEPVRSDPGCSKRASPHFSPHTLLKPGTCVPQR